jgi:hypothetical protein
MTAEYHLRKQCFIFILVLPEKTKNGFAQCANPQIVAGAPGIEPGNAGIKIQCLTAWRRPYERFEK